MADAAGHGDRLYVDPTSAIDGYSRLERDAPLNGPAWSLFLEYVANILHVFVLRKLSNRALGFLVFLAAIALYTVAITGKSGDLIGGWSLEPEQLKIGFTRLLFPCMAGMLLRRAVKVRSGKKTFVPSALLLILVLSVPRIGGYENLWMNGLYEALVISVVFPSENGWPRGLCIKAKPDIFGDFKKEALF